jgi:hypothetical protein
MARPSNTHLLVRLRVLHALGAFPAAALLGADIQLRAQGRRGLRAGLGIPCHAKHQGCTDRNTCNGGKRHNVKKGGGKGG